MPSARAGGCEFKRSVPLKSFETEPIEDAAAADSASNKHELGRLGPSSTPKIFSAYARTTTDLDSVLGRDFAGSGFAFLGFGRQASAS